MLTQRVLHSTRRLAPGLLAALLALCFLLTTSLPVFANNVRISDPVQVLNVSRVTSEGSKLSYDLDIYTTNTFSGTSSDFTSRTVTAHLTSKSLIVIAIDTTHRYLAIVGGKNVPLTTSQYNTAGTAFSRAMSGNHYTDATIAAIQSLASSLNTGSSSSTSGSSSGSGIGVVLIIVIIVGLIIIFAVVRFVRRLLGIASPARPTQQSTPHYGDGRDNLGGGTSGSF
ncbi:MAG TPA: hypothetical protein VFN35_25430 [Ktedonobacteraceae bacterium]|nr:hypothetical protein [Ktedonobacteraceae bacterium]